VKAALSVTMMLFLGCASTEEKQEDTVIYRLEGAVKAVHLIHAEPGAPSDDIAEAEGAFGQARIGCTLVNASDNVPARGQVFVVSAVENYGEEHGAGVYLKVRDFKGVGSYALDSGAGGQAWVFDEAHIQSCAREGDRYCYQGVEGCTVNVTRWDFAPGVAAKPAGYPANVTVGVAEGTFSCRRLVNKTSNTSVTIERGSFKCHASDWTK
jgi:hypothetical protein